MEIKVYKPEKKILQNYVECFYSLKRGEEERDITYIGFPSNTIFITLVLNAEVLVEGKDLTIQPSHHKTVRSILIVDNQIQGHTTYKGKTDEITIYFKPLGINAFLPKPLSNYIANTVSEFNPFEDYYTAINKIFQNTHDVLRIAGLEEYLVSKLCQFSHTFLHRAVGTILQEIDLEISISEIARRNAVSRTTFNKQFLLHIGTTPSQFIKIQRFRNALKTFTNNASKSQLLDIVYLVNYFDQSHMAKDFKSLTGYSPKTFFSKLSRVENTQISWIFL